MTFASLNSLVLAVALGATAMGSTIGKAHAAPLAETQTREAFLVALHADTRIETIPLLEQLSAPRELNTLAKLEFDLPACRAP